MRILLLVAIALMIVYALDRQTRRWLRSIGRSLVRGGESPKVGRGHAHKSRAHQPQARSPNSNQPASRQGRLVICKTCGVRVAESLAELAADGSIYCSAQCQQRADGA